MIDSAKILFQLLRAALGGETEVSLPDDVDWNEVVDLAFEQGVAALMVDGFGSTSSPTGMVEGNPLLESEDLEALRYELFGEALACEDDHRKHQQTIEKLAGLYRSEGIDMLLLKGYGLSLNYPVPEHRTSGDIDIYLYGKGGLGDALVRERFGCGVKQNEDKHSVFALDGTSVENHACFVNDAVHPGYMVLNDYLAKEAENGMNHKVCESQIVIPSAMFNALFIPVHIAGHFVHGEASVRQLCDWATFVKGYSHEIDWSTVRELSQKCGFWKFFCCLNGIVQEHLGVPEECMPDWERDKKMEARILEEILAPRKVVTSLVGKVWRFFSSRWKYKMVYNDNMLISSIRLAKSYLRQYDDKAESIWKK